MRKSDIDLFDCGIVCSWNRKANCVNHKRMSKSWWIWHKYLGCERKCNLAALGFLANCGPFALSTPIYIYFFAQGKQFVSRNLRDWRWVEVVWFETTTKCMGVYGVFFFLVKQKLGVYGVYHWLPLPVNVILVPKCWIGLFIFIVLIEAFSS